MSNAKHQFKIVNMTGDNYITWKNNLIMYLACERLNKILKRDNLRKSTVNSKELSM